jgi:deoxyribodipyrimidine photolyase-related protein
MPTTVWILGDQLADDHPALARADRRRDTVLLVESRARGAHYRYHQHKLVLVYSAMRHFAERLRAQGWQVDYHRLEDTGDFETGLKRHVAAMRPDRLLAAEPNDVTMTAALPRLARRAGVPLEVLPTNQFLLPRAEFQSWAAGRKRLLMEQHYRRMRERTGLLMEPDGSPAGGRWNFDADNRAGRKEWVAAGRPTAEPWTTDPDAITREVMESVRHHFPDHPGDAATFRLPVTRDGWRAALERFVAERLPHFGRFEDLMIQGEPVLFHSVITPGLNLGLLSPGECCDAAVAAWRAGRAPLAAVEGFVRQIIGWREFINGVYWLRMPGYTDLNELGADRPLPAWFYTGATDMNCLHQVLR